MFLNSLKKLILFSAFIAIILVILSFVENYQPVMTFAWICFGVFLVLSVITFYLAAKTMGGKFSNFMNIFFISIFSKLIITAIIVLNYKSKVNTADINFIIPFAIIYFSFLFFETVELAKMSKLVGNNHNKKGSV